MRIDLEELVSDTKADLARAQARFDEKASRCGRIPADIGESFLDDDIRELRSLKDRLKKYEKALEEERKEKPKKRGFDEYSNYNAEKALDARRRVGLVEAFFNESFNGGCIGSAELNAGLNLVDGLKDMLRQWYDEKDVTIYDRKRRKEASGD